MSRVGATQVRPAPSGTTPRRRYGFIRTYLTPKQAIPRRARLVLAVGSFVVVIGLWSILAALVQNPLFVPSPYQVVTAWVDMMVNLGFYNDVGWSAFRIVAGFLIAAVMAVPLGLLMGCRSIKGWYSGTSIDSQDTLAFSARNGVRSMNESFPLERVTEAYDRMMSGKARFRGVLTIGH